MGQGVDKVLECSHPRALVSRKSLCARPPACAPLTFRGQPRVTRCCARPRSSEGAEQRSPRFGGRFCHCHLSGPCFVWVTPVHSHSTSTFTGPKTKSVCQGQIDNSSLGALGAGVGTSLCVPRCTENVCASEGTATVEQCHPELSHHDLLPVPQKPRNLGSGQK